MVSSWGGDVTTSHVTSDSQTGDNGATETKLLVNDLWLWKAFAFTEIFEQHLCVTSSFQPK